MVTGNLPVASGNGPKMNILIAARVMNFNANLIHAYLLLSLSKTGKMLPNEVCYFALHLHPGWLHFNPVGKGCSINSRNLTDLTTEQIKRNAPGRKISANLLVALYINKLKKGSRS